MSRPATWTLYRDRWQIASRRLLVPGAFVRVVRRDGGQTNVRVGQAIAVSSFGDFIYHRLPSLTIGAHRARKLARARAAVVL